MLPRSGRRDLHTLLVTMHSANKAMEDIKQPIDNPYNDADAKTLADEITRYRSICVDREKRRTEAAALRKGIIIELRLLSGECLEAKSTLVPKNYEELQRAFLQVMRNSMNLISPAS